MKNANEFSNKKLLNLLKRFSINLELLEMSPMKWKSNKTYVSSKNLINPLKIINNTFEKNVKLIGSSIKK